MDYSAASPMGNPPQLGTPIPGTTGGLPMQGGLNVAQNPMAQQLQSQGRGEDSMLVHMTPDEVNSLQGLAMAHGGSLTINPETGLPEAGWLGKLLPTILGAALTATGVGAPLAAGLVAAGSVAKTGSLKKGLMAGLQAYGGASLAGGLGVGAAGAAKDVGIQAAMKAGDLSGVAAQAASQAGQTAAKTGLAGIAQGFGTAARAGLPAGTPGIISKAAPMLAASGLMQGVSGAMAPKQGTMGSDGIIDNSYQGPYTAQKRKATFAANTGELLGSSKERRYFDVGMPEVYNMQGQVVQPGSSTARGTPIMQNVINPNAKKGQNRYNQILTPYMVDPQQDEEGMSYAGGGEVALADGAFVLDARTVSEIGNGSSSAGIEALRRLGGRPVRGKGDGVSDSIPARIGRDQPARVARDEVVMPADAVRRIGKGNPKKGANKLYALMNKAHKARKKAKRGQDTKVRRGLA